MGRIENDNHRIKVLLTIGYYQGATLDYKVIECEDDNIIEGILYDLEENFKLYCDQLIVSVSFSNGETWYERVDE